MSRRKRYSAEFKREAIRRADEEGKRRFAIAVSQASQSTSTWRWDLTLWRGGNTIDPLAEFFRVFTPEVRPC